ncbi:methyltransferase domain-containing protein [Leptothoe sp. EHU-05/26/07-4]
MSNYYAGSENEATELERRKLVESIHNDINLNRFNRIGIRQGWRCLEVGAGAGSIAYWLTEQVGSTGHVTATDIALRFLQSDKYSNLEIKLYDFESDALEEDVFDFIHSRNVLMHLENPTDALRKLTMALKSGGYIVLEEPDFSTFLTEGEPKDSLASVRYAFGYIESAISSKRMSLYLGGKLPAILDNLGLENVITDEHCTIQNGGSKLASIHCRG